MPLRISLAIALLLLAGVALFLLPDPGSGAKQDPARSGRAAPASDFRDSGTGEDEEPPSSDGGTIRGSVLTPEGLSAGGARVRLLRVRWPARLSSTGSSLAGSVFQLDLTSDALVLFSDLTDSWTDESETTADEQGVFRFPSVPEGTYLVCASSVASVWSTDGLLISCPGSSEFSADIAIRLRPALDVQLRVLGDERPVEGARITLSGFLGERSERPADVPLSVSRIWELILNPPAAELWTDSAGFARISTLPALDYVVRAGSPDHGRIETTYSVWEPGVNCLPREGADPVRIETRPKVLRLTAGVPIEGLVVDPQGFPIRGATLFLLREPGLKGKLLTPAIRQDVVSTDASGQYRFDHVPTGVYTILVEKFGFVPQLKEDFFSETAAALPLDFTLEPGGVLPGVVLDEAGLPLSGVVVRSAGKLGSVVSDEQGRFEVVANQYGGALATFSHPCFSSAAVVLINPVEPKEVTLQRMPEVRGRVIDPGGRPIEGASVELRAPRDLAGFSDPASGALQKDNYLGATAAAGALISDRDGRFSGCPAPGSGLGGAASAVHIFAPGFERRIEPLGDSSPEELGDLVLSPTSVLSGRTFDPAGNPLPAARVVITSAEDEGAWDVFTQTDQDGRYLIPIPRAGESFEVSARHPRFRFGDKVPLPLTRPGEALELDLSFTPGAALRCRVRFDGSPAAGAWIELRHESTTRSVGVRPSALTDDTGTHLFEGLLPGRHDYTIECPGAGSRRGEVVLVEGETALLVEDMTSANALEGVVLSEAGRVPEGASVILFDRFANPYSSSVDADGRFEVRGFTPGSVKVRATAPGFSQEETAWIDPKEGPLRFTLRPSTRLTVSVFDALDGRPVSGARVVRLGPTAEELDRAVSDVDGMAELRKIPAGAQRIRIEAQDRARMLRTISIGAGPAELSVSLPPGQEVVGTVIDPSGAPLPGATVEVSQREPAEDSPPWARLPFRWRSGPDGRLRIAGLAAGATILEVSRDGFRTGRIELEIPAGGTTPTVTIELAPVATLTCRVLDREGATIRGARVLLSRASGEVLARTESDRSGACRFPQVDPGSYRLILQSGGRERSFPVRVRSAEPVELDLEL